MLLSPTACREGEIFCGHSGAHRSDYGDPAGLCLHGDGFSDGGERAGTAACCVPAAAQRYASTCFSQLIVKGIFRSGQHGSFVNSN